MPESNRFPAKLGFQNKYGPCDEAKLCEWEKTLPLGKLPEDYREFLLQWNGGKFHLRESDEEDLYEYVGFPAFLDEDEVEQFDGDANEAGLIDEFVGFFNEESIDDIRQASGIHGFRGAVPDAYLVIGSSNFEESLVCISVDGVDFGAIYLWAGEPWREEPEPTTEYLFHVTSSFAKFWQIIQVVAQD